MIHRSFCVTILLCLALAISVSGEEQRLTASQLRAKGIETSKFQPIAFSHDSRLLAAFDRAPFEEKKKGVFFRLWFFQVQRDGRFGSVRSVALPLKNLQQGEFTPDDSRFVLVGNRGRKFVSVDTSTLEVTTILEPKLGNAGFKAEPPVLWTEAGKLFVTGIPYDEARFVETQTVAVLDPTKTGKEAFQRGPDTMTLEKGLERLWFANYVTDKSAFFGQKYPQVTLLSHWNGEDVVEFDRAWQFLGFWGNAGRLLYSRKRGEADDFELVLHDTSDDSNTVLKSSATNFSYLFLSRDGTVLLTSQLVAGKRMVPFYAREDEEWELKPVAGLDSGGNPRTVSAGWMRLASDGSAVIHIGQAGLTLYPLAR